MFTCIRWRQISWRHMWSLSGPDDGQHWVVVPSCLKINTSNPSLSSPAGYPQEPPVSKLSVFHREWRIVARNMVAVRWRNPASWFLGPLRVTGRASKVSCFCWARESHSRFCWQTLATGVLSGDQLYQFQTISARYLCIKHNKDTSQQRLCQTFNYCK